MNIGIDMDGVIIDDDRYILDHVSKFLYENGLGQMTSPKVYEDKFLFSESDNLKYREKYFFDYIENATPFDFAREVIYKLHEKGHNIFIITARFKTTSDCAIGKKMRTLTKKWLDKNNIYYDELVFCLPPKLNELKKFDIDLMLEDSPINIVEMAKITKVACFNTQYNFDLDLPNVVRVFSWYDFLSKFESFLEN